MTYSPYDFTSKALCTVSEICDIICVAGLAAFAAATLNNPLTPQEKRIEQNVHEIKQSQEVTDQYLNINHASSPIFQSRTPAAQY